MYKMTNYYDSNFWLNGFGLFEVLCVCWPLVWLLGFLPRRSITHKLDKTVQDEQLFVYTKLKLINFLE